ncbi:hypothetical protein EV1_020290 [Malus domestica]
MQPPRLLLHALRGSGKEKVQVLDHNRGRQLQVRVFGGARACGSGSGWSGGGGGQVVCAVLLQELSGDGGGVPLESEGRVCEECKKGM